MQQRLAQARRRGGGVAFVVLALLLAATPATALRVDPFVDSCARDEANCCFAESKWPKPSMESRFRCEPDEDGSYPCSVRLAVSDWIGSFINVYVAKIFIEEFLGYPVEITADSSDYTGTVKESDTYASNGTLIEPSGMRRMSSGEIDVILEYWPSGHRDNIREFVVEKSTIKLAGENGIEGRIGWFMPSFVGEENDPALDYWRTLTDPAKASLFPHSTTSAPCCRSDMDQGANAPCVPTEALGGTKVTDGGMANATAECDVFSDTSWHKIPTTGGRFLGGKPTWTTHDDQIIRNLNLTLTLVLAVSESKIMEEIKTAHESRTPLLFYFWKPHGAFRMYDLDDFLLPLSSAECRSAQTSGDAKCGYPIELLAKAYSVSLEESKPDVAHFVESMVFNSTVQQEEIHYELLVNSSRTLNEAACEWVKINEQTWSDWTESVENRYEGQTWQDEILEPTVMACDCKPDGLRDVVAVYDTSAYAEDGSVIIDVDPNPCSEARNVSLYKTRWSTMLLETEVLKEIQCAHVPLGSSGEIIILTLASIAWLVLLICLVFAVAYRKHKALKSARIRTLMILLFGAALMNGAETFQIGEPTRVKCAMRFSLLLFGFMYFVGSLLIKQYIITMVLRRTRYDRRKGSRGQLFMKFEFTICTLVALALFVIWYAVVGFEPEAVVADVLLDVDELVCPTDSTLLMLIIAVCYLLIVVSCVLASQTRGLSGLVFNEGKFMLFSNYNVAVLTGLSLFVTLSPGMDASLKSLFVSFCILFSTMSCALLVVGSRVYAASLNLDHDMFAAATTRRSREIPSTPIKPKPGLASSSAISPT